ncbi:Exosome complex component RRP45 [Nymphon striatum]|nr:Exosome complex component RRP45 [Nymphon striatum]
MISNGEREFIQEGVLQDRRIDGRHSHEFRNLEIVFGSNYGCCQVSLGKTRAIAQVSSEVVSPQASRPSEGVLFVSVELSPMAAPEFEPGKPSDAAVEVSRIVERCIRDSRCVDLESLCIITSSQVWQIRVDVHVINHEGNLTDCACLAAMISLLHFRRPDVTVSGEDVIIHPIEKRDPIPLSIHHIPICITFSFFDNGNRLLVDPTEREECAMEGKMVFGMNSHREICTLHMGGRMLLLKDQILRCAEIAAIRAAEITKKIKKCIAEDSEKRKARKNVGFQEHINLKKLTVNELLTCHMPDPEPATVLEESGEVMEIQDEAKIVVRGPRTAGLSFGSGGSNKWIEISDDDQDMDEEETNIKESKSSTPVKKIEMKNTHLVTEEDVIVLKPSEFESDNKVDLTKALKKKKSNSDNSDVDYEPMESDNETIDSYESDDVDLSEHEDDGVMLSDSWKRIADIFSDCRPNSLPELVRNFSGVNPALNCNANNSVLDCFKKFITNDVIDYLVNLVQEIAGLIVKDDVAAELRPARIDRDMRDLKKVIKQIEDSRNPFEMEVETKASQNKLFNINTGKATSDEMRESLLKIPENKKARHQDFLDSSITDPYRFEDKITKAKRETFSDDCAKTEEQITRE